MSDDLVKRLRDGCSCDIDSSPCMAEEECRDAYAAADRIEELEAENRLLKDAVYIDDLTVTGMADDKAALRASIEELEAKLTWVIVERDETFALMLDRVQTAEAKLAKAADVIDWALICWDDHQEHGYHMQGDWVRDARTTLAELTGGKDE